VPEDAEETANMFSEKEYTDLAGLIWKLMAYKPCERISAAEALEDPFFAVGRP
jgi:serine/threonine protein kinase